MNTRVRKLSSLAAGQPPDSDTLYTDDAGRLQTDANVSELVSAVGATSAAAAPADGTGSYGVIAALKRGLLNWSSLLARIPQPIIPGMVPVDVLAAPVRCHVATASGTTSSVTLAAGTRRVSVDATGGAAFCRCGAAGDAASVPSAGAAVANTMAIPAGTTKDFDLPAGTTHLHFIRDGAVDAAIRVTELS